MTPDTLPRVNTYEHDLASPEQAFQKDLCKPCKLLASHK